jgi:hypothetical protein
VIPQTPLDLRGRTMKRSRYLPLKRGRAGTRTHDYKRNGTITLLAALDVLEGKVIGRCMQRPMTSGTHSLPQHH